MPETLTRQERWQEKQRAAGKCWKCGEPAEEKPTSTPEAPQHYKLCKTHRAKDLARKS